MSSPALLHGRDARELQSGVFIGDVADLSRTALVAFLRLGNRGAAPVTHAQLADWLFGPYLDALTVGHRSLVETEPSLVLDDGEAPDETTDLMISSAAAAIERVLAAFREDPDLSVAARLLERRVIEPIIDERGGQGFAPFGSPGMPLSVRVLSLAAAELLTRPARLRGDLVVGPMGIEIADRPIISGVAIRSRQTLPWTPPRAERPSLPGWPARAPTLAELVAAQDDPGLDLDLDLDLDDV